ncbi:MAG: SMP-30/gluconolactonase/LRE family protein [Phycisphaerales bacterium]|nr:SMP-30/gluconolactonase/LRE family protein [Phycisphaerales bacterium]
MSRRCTHDEPGRFPIERIRAFGDGIDHSEGVAVAPDGTVYAGGEMGQIYRISDDGMRTEQFACTGGFILGITLDQRGNLYVCDKTRRELIRIDPCGQLTSIADRAPDGSRLRQPNYSVFDADGNLYLTDSGQFKGCDGMIHRIRQDGRIELFDAGPFAFPNGLAINANEDALFVIESNLDRVCRIEIKSDGTAGDRSIYCSGLAHVPDGMAFDAAGNLLVACYGLNHLYRVDPSGQVALYCQDLENYRLPTPTNLAFGGKQMDRLYVACLGARCLAVLEPVAPGMPLYSHSHLKRGL